MKQILFACLLFGLLTACQETRKEQFAHAARTLTEQCPVSIDPYTRLDSLVYQEADSSFHYYYSMSGAGDNEFAGMIAYPSFAEKIKKSVKNSIEMKPYKDAGITFLYHYYSLSSGIHLGNIKITPEDYRH